MTHEPLSGPDFLDSVADVEEANCSYINAAEYRRRATQWREEARARHQAEARLMIAEDTAREDAALLDFLADRQQNIANVTLPSWAVLQNVASLRCAIRAVMDSVKTPAANQTPGEQSREQAHG